MLKDYEKLYYERASEDGSWIDPKSRRREIVDFIVKNHQKGDAILEVGCGAGTIIKHLPAGVSYTGIDSSVHAIEQAQKFSSGMKAAFFSSADPDKLNFPDQNFNFVISVFALEHFKSPKKMLDEMVRTLKKEGHLILLAPNLELPFSLPNAVRHKNYLYKIGLFLLKLKDYFLRLFGYYRFRVVEQNFSEATGKYEKPDDDLTYIVSSFEVINYLEDSHNLRPVYVNAMARGHGLKGIIKKMITCLPGMKYYGDLLFIIMRK